MTDRDAIAAREAAAEPTQQAVLTDAKVCRTMSTGPTRPMKQTTTTRSLHTQSGHLTAGHMSFEAMRATTQPRCC